MTWVTMGTFQLMTFNVLTNYEILLMKWILPTFDDMEFDSATPILTTGNDQNHIVTQTIFDHPILKHIFCFVFKHCYNRIFSQNLLEREKKVWLFFEHYNIWSKFTINIKSWWIFQPNKLTVFTRFDVGSWIFKKCTIVNKILTQ